MSATPSPSNSPKSPESSTSGTTGTNRISQNLRDSITKIKHELRNSNRPPNMSPDPSSSSKTANQSNSPKPEPRTSRKIETKPSNAKPMIPSREATMPNPKSDTIPSSIRSRMPRQNPIRKQRIERFKTISQICYRNVRKKIHKKNLIRGIFLFIILSIFFVAVFWTRIGQLHPQRIIESVDQGILALSEDRLDEATRYFQSALEEYKTYHITHPERWWKSDAKIFTTAFRLMQGWRSLGDMEKALQTIQQIAHQNSAGTDTWVGRQMEEEIRDFVSPTHWSEEQLRELFSRMMKIDPASWGTCGITLIHGTELLSLHLEPLANRMKNSDFIFYGTPQPMSNPQANEMEVSVIRFYSVDRIENSLTIKISPDLSVDQRERLEWYSQSQRKCLFFATNPDEPLLRGVNDIVLSESYSVDEFNRQYRD